MSQDSSVNAKRLLWAGFMAILAAGVGFAIRGGIFDNWAREFGFTFSQLGAIGGAGFTGFCFGIIIGGVIADKIGYGKLVVAAFAFHVLSAFITFAATEGQDQSTAYALLFWGMFTFAIANGVLEAVANPLIATLFPENRTHYLNILHASWPAGLILGGVAGWVLDDNALGILGEAWHWKSQLALYLIPTALYGVMFFGQRMPKSAASEQGLGLGEMFKDVGILGGLVVCFLLALFLGGSVFGALFDESMARVAGYVVAGVLLLAVGAMTQFSLGSFLLFTLFIAHALVGAVELGTDGWIQNITGNILTSEQGKILFVYTSALMFTLRFCANFIEKKLGLSPIGILLTCSVLACIGLNLVSTVETFIGALLALSVYAVGKTFFWPTMLAVASDRFPRTGAVAISIMGGIGMLSAGLIGSAGLGYCKDRFSGEALAKANAPLYASYKSEQVSSFLIFADSYGLDAIKTGEVAEKLTAARKDLENQGMDPTAAVDSLSEDERTVHEAGITGDRNTLIADSAIPAAMAVLYLLIMLYFKSIGGYKVEHLNGGGGSESAGGDKSGGSAE
jgi:MFS family permease